MEHIHAIYSDENQRLELICYGISLGGNRFELKAKYDEFRMQAHQRDAAKYIDE